MSHLYLTVFFFLLLFLQFIFFFFFFNDPAPPEISPLPLHDALPISRDLHANGQNRRQRQCRDRAQPPRESAGLRPSSLLDRARYHRPAVSGAGREDRKSTRLNSSHSQISYAVFCLKKKKTHIISIYD